MRLYRYRPEGPLLYKELRYSELYLATPQELNDPLDLSGRIHFPADDDRDIKHLCNFLFRQAVACHGAIETFRSLRELMSTETLGTFLKAKFSASPNEAIMQDELFEILAQYYSEVINRNGKLRVYFNEFAPELDRLFKKYLYNSAVLCFSETPDDFQMWSHYSSGHSGLCIAYDLHDDPRAPDTARLPVVFDGGEEWSEPVKKVQYRETLPSVNFYDFLPVFANDGDIDLEHLSKARWHPYAESLEQLFLCKLLPWASEREWRKVETSFRPTLPEDRLYTVNPKAITEIYFGARASRQMRRRVRRIFELQNPKVQYYTCIVDGSLGVRFSKDERDEYAADDEY